MQSCGVWRSICAHMRGGGHHDVSFGADARRIACEYAAPDARCARCGSLCGAGNARRPCTHGTERDVPVSFGRSDGRPADESFRPARANGRCGRSPCRDGRDCLAAAISGKQYGRGGVHVCPRVLRAAPLSNTVSDGRICKCARSVPDAPAVCAHGACKRCLREHSADLSAGGRGARSRARGGAGGDLCRGADSAAAGDARAEHTPVRA